MSISFIKDIFTYCAGRFRTITAPRTPRVDNPLILPTRERLPVVYIAGPFRGPTAWDIEENVRHAERTALQVSREGFVPLCPHTNTRFFQGQGSDQFWLDATLELLRRCDALLTVPDWIDMDGKERSWKNSKGTAGEVAEARAQGIPVFHSIEEMKANRGILIRNKVNH